MGVVRDWVEKDRIYLDTGQELRASLDDKDFESLEKSLVGEEAEVVKLEPTEEGLSQLLDLWKAYQVKIEDVTKLRSEDDGGI